MRRADKGFWLLVVVTGCWLANTVLPLYQKLWFVAPSGNYGGGQWAGLLLLLLLFWRWQPARLLLLLVTSLQVGLSICVLCYNAYHNGPLLGFALVLPLQTLMVVLLAYSISIRQFLARKPSQQSAF